MGWDGMHLGLMGFAAVREAAAKAEEQAGKMLSTLTGKRCVVRIEGAQRLPCEALPILLQSIRTEGPCLCGPLEGDIEGRLVVWPAKPTGTKSEGATESPPRHDWVADSLGQGLIPALQEFAGIRVTNGPFRLKNELCYLPEEWDEDAEAWIWSMRVRANNRRYLVRVALITPTGDAISLFRALCMEEAA